MNSRKDSANIHVEIATSGDQVMTSVEAAAYLKIHVKTVCRLAKQGKIPARKVGRDWRFLRNVLDRWLTEELS